MRFVLLNAYIFPSTIINTMEQHPVPQNVTTFQFRLIGDMTLKQFGYLCAGAILAFIAYKLPLPFIITWPLTMVFVFLGIGFAFIPVEERPMDVWVFSFFKSIYTPTQYLWTREPVQQHTAPPSVATNLPQPTPPPATQPPAPVSVPQPAHPRETLVTAPTPPAGIRPVTPPVVTGSGHPVPPPPAPVTVQQPKTPEPQASAVLSDLFRSSSPPAPPPAAPAMTMHRSESVWDRILAFLGVKPVHTIAPAHTTPVVAPRMKQVAVPSVTGLRPVVPEQQAQTMHAQPPAAQDTVVHEKVARLEENIANLEQKLKSTSSAEDRVLELQKQLTDLLNQKSKTDDELASLRRAMLSKPDPAPAPQAGHEERRGSVNMITTQEAAVKAGLPRLTNVPNVITGIVKDDEGNLLPSILVTVTNAEGLPMRALKTNKLGQFGASTPLASGTYYVEIEDPRGKYTFSRVQITLSGGVLPVLEILAKSEKALTREKLTKEIFGTPNT